MTVVNLIPPDVLESRRRQRHIHRWAVAVVLDRGWHRLRGRPLALPWTVAVLITGAAAVSSTVSVGFRTTSNALGLVSFEPGRDWVYDYANQTNKDDYPPCRFVYNSLGYRDVEPPTSPKGERRRLLIVGDSFVWEPMTW